MNLALPVADPALHKLARQVAVAGVAALILLCVAWELWLAPTGTGTLALKALPLVPALIGLVRAKLYTFRWLSLVLWLYFCEGVVRATSERGLGQWLAGLEVLLTLVVFAACVLHIRNRRVEPA
jgi:uncharacterized membrane protein